MQRLLLFTLLALSIQLYAQQNLRWETIIQGNDGDLFSNVSYTPDGGCLLLSSSTSTDGVFSDNHGNRDGYIAKYDADGNVVWDYVFGGSNTENFNDVIPTSDGGFIVAGSTSSSDGDLDQFGSFSGLKELLVKFSSDGNVEWLDIYSSGNVRSVKIDNQGNIYTITPYGSLANGNIRISKYDSNGIRIWNKSDSGLAISENIDFAVDGDGNVYRLMENITTDEDFNLRITKFDAEGIELWNNVYGGGGSEGGNVIEIQGDRLIVGGSTRSTTGDITTLNGNTDGFIAYINFDGSFMSSSSFGGSNIDKIDDLKIRGDKIFVTGHSKSMDNDIVTPYTESFDIYLAELDITGNIVWIEYSGGSENDLFGNIDVVNDSLIVLGYSSSSTDGNLEGADTEPSIYMACYDYQDIVNTKELNKVDFSIYPNPTTNLISIGIEDYQEYGLKIFDSKGSLIKVLDDLKDNQLDISNLPCGVLSISLYKNGVLVGSKPIFKQ